MAISVHPKVLRPATQPNVSGTLTLKATTDVVVAPFYRDYHQTLVLKLFLGMEGEPVERLAKLPMNRLSPERGPVARSGWNRRRTNEPIRHRLRHTPLRAESPRSVQAVSGSCPVSRLKRNGGLPMFQKPHDVLCTFEEALEVMRKTDNLTRGIPKIIYLVG